MRVSGQLTSGDAVAWIGVTSPSSPHRLEALRAGTFHIGRGKSCHLRLGDESIPDVLAIIVVDRVSARISAQAPEPAILLNGEPVEDSALSDGDLLQAGPYSLVFHRLPNDAMSANNDENRVIDAAGASAAELVDALEEELSVVEELAHTPIRGWQTLATRLAQTGSESDEDADCGMDQRSSDADGPDVIPIDDVRALLVALERGQQNLRLQNEAILQELADLKRRQRELADSILPPADSVVPIRSADSIPPRRASA